MDEGFFCWVDLSAHDYDRAVAFYGEAFEWTHETTSADGPGRYGMFSHDGQVVAGIGEVPQDMQERMPSVWNSYVAVADAAAAAARAEELGGKVIFDAYETPSGTGRLSSIQDPTGAVVAVWEAGTHAGGAKFNTPVSLCWQELATRDAETAAAFYTALFGWEMPLQDGELAATIAKDGRPQAHVLRMNDQWEGVPPAWSPYFAVEDTDAMVVRVKAAGGAVPVGPVDIPAGRFAVIADAQGAHCYVMQLSEPLG
jgi:predicted enzyme related to lactoylglutathione lyase